MMVYGDVDTLRRIAALEEMQAIIAKRIVALEAKVATSAPALDRQVREPGGKDQQNQAPEK